MKKVIAPANIKRIDDSNDPFGFDNWVLFIEEEERVIAEIVDQWVRSDNAQEVLLEIRITSPFQQKTHKQMGYYFAEVLQKITKGYQMYGNEYDTDKVDQILVNKYLSEPIYDPTTDTWDKIKIGKAKASKEQMSYFLDQCIRFASENFPEFPIEDPETYKRKHGYTDQEWYGN